MTTPEWENMMACYATKNYDSYGNIGSHLLGQPTDEPDKELQKRMEDQFDRLADNLKYIMSHIQRQDDMLTQIGQQITP